MEKESFDRGEGVEQSFIRMLKNLTLMGFFTSQPGARMGNDPKRSVLNRFNQCHDALNVFVTDGSCMVSSACQNPSLTYMALTARACDYAVKELKRGNL